MVLFRIRSVLTLCMGENYNFIVSPSPLPASKKKLSPVRPAFGTRRMLITRKVEFSASHICRVPELSEEENRRLFGLAANPSGHGHNYVLEVSLRGEPDAVTGMVLDLKELKDILVRYVVEPYDHRFLNYEVPPFDRIVPTTENIARDIWQRLAPHLNNGRHALHAIRVYETPDLYVDYYGEEPCTA